MNSTFTCLLLATHLLAACHAAVAQNELFVTNSNSNAVTVYALFANGNVAPLRTLSGNATGLANPSGIAVDVVHDELIVANKTPPYSVTVYPRTASGNVAPLRTITGASTKLNDPRGISVDTTNNEFAVANRAGFSITVFARTTNGNLAPLRTLQTMGLSNPWGVLIDVPHNEIVVANNGDFLSVFPRSGNGMVAPLRTISGSNTGFNNGPVGITLDTMLNEYVVTTPFFGAGFQPAILFFGRTAAGNVLPSRAIGGNPATTGLTNPNGLAISGVELFVPNSIGNSIAVHQTLLTGNAPPIRTIVGAATLLNNPQFAAVTTDLDFDRIFADDFE